MNFHSIRTMYSETRCVFYILSPEAWGYKIHSLIHNTSYGMKIHLRYSIYVISELFNSAWFLLNSSLKLPIIYFSYVTVSNLCCKTYYFMCKQ